MNRFWKHAGAVPADGGWAIELDGKPLRTPGRNAFTVPSEALARAVAAEWDACAEAVDPRAMPLTGIANAAIDRVASDSAAFAKGVANYAAADLLCYRAESPRELRARQEQVWDSLLSWGRRRFDVDFETTCGIVHVAQPAATVHRLGHAVAALDPFRLAALSLLVSISGSLIIGLGVAEGAIAADEAWSAATIDEQWQRDQWGADEEALAALDTRRRDFMGAARFVELLGG